MPVGLDKIDFSQPRPPIRKSLPPKVVDDIEPIEGADDGPATSTSSRKSVESVIKFPEVQQSPKVAPSDVLRRYDINAADPKPTANEKYPGKVNSPQKDLGKSPERTQDGAQEEIESRPQVSMNDPKQVSYDLFLELMKSFSRAFCLLGRTSSRIIIPNA